MTALLPVRIGTFVSVITIGAQEKTGRKKIKTVEPIYPPLPGQLHLSGTVKMVLQINPEGKVSGVHTVGGNAMRRVLAPSPPSTKSTTCSKKRWGQGVSIKPTVRARIIDQFRIVLGVDQARD